MKAWTATIIVIVINISTVDGVGGDQYGVPLPVGHAEAVLGGIAQLQIHFHALALQPGSPPPRHQVAPDEGVPQRDGGGQHQVAQQPTGQRQRLGLRLRLRRGGGRGGREVVIQRGRGDGARRGERRLQNGRRHGVEQRLRSGSRCRISGTGDAADIIGRRLGGEEVAARRVEEGGGGRGGRGCRHDEVGNAALRRNQQRRVVASVKRLLLHSKELGFFSSLRCQ